MGLSEVNNSGVHSSFFRSELYLSTKNQSWRCCWKQAEDGSRRCKQAEDQANLIIVISIFPVMTGTREGEWYMSW